MTTKFTPGPWKPCFHLESIDNYTKCQCGYRGGIWSGDGESVVCEMGATKMEGGLPSVTDPATILANAALIAAAPETIDALEKLSNEVSGLIGNYEPMLSEMIGNTNAAVLHQRLLEARAVMEKARGAKAEGR